MILGADNRKRWSKWDILLAEAYSQFERERCGQCGYPQWVCGSESNDIYFRLEEVVCYATRKREEHSEREQEKRSKKKNAKEPKGVSVTIEALTYSGKPLTDYRAPFYKRMAELRDEREQSRKVIPAEDRAASTR